MIYIHKNVTLQTWRKIKNNVIIQGECIYTYLYITNNRHPLIDADN